MKLVSSHPYFRVLCSATTLLTSELCYSLVHLGPVALLASYGYTCTCRRSLVAHDSPGCKHLLQPCLPLNCTEFITKHFAGKSQVPAKSMTFDTNGCGYNGDLTSTPLDSKADSSIVSGFKNNCMLGIISPNHSHANKVLSLSILKWYGSSLIIK